MCTKVGAEVLLIIDACRNSVSIDKDNNSNYMGANEKLYVPNFLTLYSTKNGKVAYESNLIGGGHGLFSYNLVQALSGKADRQYDADNNGIVSFKELVTWLKTVVPKQARDCLSLNSHHNLVVKRMRIRILHWSISHFLINWKKMKHN